MLTRFHGRSGTIVCSMRLLLIIIITTTTSHSFTQYAEAVPCFATGQWMFCPTAHAELKMNHEDEPLESQVWRYTYTHNHTINVDDRLCLTLPYFPGQEIKLEVGLGVAASIHLRMSDVDTGVNVNQCHPAGGMVLPACESPNVCYSTIYASVCRSFSTNDYNVPGIAYLSFHFQNYSNVDLLTDNANNDMQSPLPPPPSQQLKEKSEATARPLQVNMTILSTYCPTRWQATPNAWSMCARTSPRSLLCTKERNIECIVEPWGAVQPQRACEVRTSTSRVIPVPRPDSFFNCSAGEPGECSCDHLDCYSGRGNCTPPYSYCSCFAGYAGARCEYDLNEQIDASPFSATILKWWTIGLSVMSVLIVTTLVVFWVRGRRAKHNIYTSPRSNVSSPGVNNAEHIERLTSSGIASVSGHSRQVSRDML